MNPSMSHLLAGGNLQGTTRALRRRLRASTRVSNPVWGCAPKELDHQGFASQFPKPHAAGCRLYTSCGCPPGWVTSSTKAFWGIGKTTGPVVCCPPTCRVCPDDAACAYYDQPTPQCPTKDSGYPAPPGFFHTPFPPAGYQHIPHFEDVVNICCPERESPGAPKITPGSVRPQRPPSRPSAPPRAKAKPGPLRRLASRLLAA